MSANRYRDLREFIARLEADGELIRIKEKVSPILQITEITDRVCKSSGGGKALLFENVEGSDIPVLTNAYGSEKRMASALGVTDVEEIASRIESFLNMAPPETAGDKLKTFFTLLEVAKFPPKKIYGKPPCQQVVLTGKERNLFKFPVLKCWPHDDGHFVTFPLVFTESLSGRRNVGMYRIQIFDKNTTGMHWHIHKDGAHDFHEYKKAGKKMPLSVAIGTDPAVTYSATAPLPRPVDELLLAGFLRKSPVRLAKCLTNDLWVPADAEIILEGYVDPAEEFRVEGPFGDHTGYYSLADDYPVFHVTAITHRKNPIYFATVVGKPPMEDCYMGRATSRIFLPLLKTAIPEIVDYNLPWEGVFHNCVIVSMEKRFPAAAHRLMSAMWGTGQMSFSKMILTLGEDADVQNCRAVLREFLDNFCAKEDLFYSEGPLDALDHSAPLPLRGSKLGIDATPRLKGEKARTLPKLDTLDEKLLAREIAKHAGIKGFHIPEKQTKNRVIICALDKEKQGMAIETAGDFLSGPAGGMLNIAVMVDENITPANLSDVAWKLFNNVDPQRDILLRGGNLLIDATKKTRAHGHEREWPDDIEMDDKTKTEVDEIWPRLGIK